MSGPRPRLFSLTWPLFLELLLGIGVGLAGTALAARLSDAAGGAFALALQVSGMLFILFRVIGAGTGVVVTQSLGAGHRAAADRVARATLGASTWIGGLTGAAAAILATPLLRLLNAPADVLPLAQPLLVALAPAMLLDAWNASMSSVLRAHLKAREALAVIVVTQLVHLALLAPLMHGAGPVPALGLSGFAVALVAARAVGLALHLWLWGRRLGVALHLPDWWRLPRAELAAVLHIGLPGAAENVAYRLAMVASVAAVAHLGTRPLATLAYVQQLSFIAVTAALAVGLSVETAVGHLIGAGQLHEAHRLVRRALLRGLLASLGAALAMALAAPWAMRLFSDDPAVVALGGVLLWWTVVLEPGRTFNLVVINALRAAGDARFPVMAGAASMLLVLAGGSWLLGVHLGLGLVGVWLAYIADEWVRGLLMWRRWVTLAWVPKARAAHRRLRAERPALAARASRPGPPIRTAAAAPAPAATAD